MRAGCFRAAKGFTPVRDALSHPIVLGALGEHVDDGGASRAPRRAAQFVIHARPRSRVEIAYRGRERVYLALGRGAGRTELGAALLAVNTSDPYRARSRRRISTLPSRHASTGSCFTIAQFGRRGRLRAPTSLPNSVPLRRPRSRLLRALRKRLLHRRQQRQSHRQNRPRRRPSRRASPLSSPS